MMNDTETNKKALDKVESIAFEIKEKIDELVNLSRNEDEEVRLWAVREIGELGIIHKILKNLGLWQSDQDELVRLEALEVIDSYYIDWSSKIGISSLYDNSELVRGRSAEIFAKMNRHEIIPIIISRLSNCDEEEIYRFYLSLVLLGEYHYLPQYLKGIYNKTYQIRCYVANTVHLILNKNNRDLIRSLLEDRLHIENTVAVRSSIKNALSSNFLT